MRPLDLTPLRELRATPDYRALVTAIRAAPLAELTPQLVLADFIQEHGLDDYAAFIRARCAGEHPYATGRQVQTWFNLNGWQPKSAFLPQSMRVRYLHDEIYDEGPKWPREWAGEGYLNGGFLYSLSMPVEWVVKELDAVLPAHPVRSVEVIDWGYVDNGPVIRPEIPNFAYTVAGKPVLADPEKCQLISDQSGIAGGFESRLAEYLFSLRWPGVTFTVKI